MNARLFLALYPEAEVRGQLAAWRDGWQWPKSAGPVRSDMLHLTLHFIGDVDEGRIADVADALSVPFRPFDLSFGTALVWPHGIAVLEPRITPPALTELWQTLRERLIALDLPVDERRYKPHVTLARRAGAAVQHTAGPPIDWHVTGYALMRSRGGYETVRQYSS